MSIITSQVNIKKRYWESPSSQDRYHEPYQWRGCISTKDHAYKNIPIKYKTNSLNPIKPSDEYLSRFSREDGLTYKYYYLCEFNMSDFNLNGKVSTDMGCDETGKHFYIDENILYYYSVTENPLENEENTMYINRMNDGTFHLNTGFELLAELEERGYNGIVWAIVSDECN